ncbi:MAG: hypothetical protein GTO13_00160 [Proteobacteria bacterium]|nr:hypothetical protein [Pseudomonadota bacterium]
MWGKNTGLYLGTEIVGRKVWKRYLKDKLFARGNGKYWFDGTGFYFLRYLTSRPIHIPFSDIIQIQLGTKHAGRWAMGNLIVKIIWRKDTLTLSSGFLVSKKRESVKAFKAELEKIIHKTGARS